MNLDATPKSKWIGEPDYDFAVKDKDADTIFFSLTQMHATSPFDQHEGRGQPLGALLGRRGEGHLQTSLQSHHFAATSIHTNTSKHRCEVCNTIQLFVPWSTLTFCLR